MTFDPLTTHKFFEQTDSNPSASRTKRPVPPAIVDAALSTARSSSARTPELDPSRYCVVHEHAASCQVESPECAKVTQESITTLVYDPEFLKQASAVLMWDDKELRQFLASPGGVYAEVQPHGVVLTRLADGETLEIPLYFMGTDRQAEFGRKFQETLAKVAEAYAKVQSSASYSVRRKVDRSLSAASSDSSGPTVVAAGQVLPPLVQQLTQLQAQVKACEEAFTGLDKTEENRDGLVELAGKLEKLAGELNQILEQNGLPPYQNDAFAFWISELAKTDRVEDEIPDVADAFQEVCFFAEKMSCFVQSGQTVRLLTESYTQLLDRLGELDQELPQNLEKIRREEQQLDLLVQRIQIAVQMAQTSNLNMKDQLTGLLKMVLQGESNRLYTERNFVTTEVSRLLEEIEKDTTSIGDKPQFQQQLDDYVHRLEQITHALTHLNQTAIATIEDQIPEDGKGFLHLLTTQAMYEKSLQEELDVSGSIPEPARDELKTLRTRSIEALTASVHLLSSLRERLDGVSCHPLRAFQELQKRDTEYSTHLEALRASIEESVRLLQENGNTDRGNTRQELSRYVDQLKQAVLARVSLWSDVSKPLGLEELEESRTALASADLRDTQSLKKICDQLTQRTSNAIARIKQEAKEMQLRLFSQYLSSFPAVRKNLLTPFTFARPGILGIKLDSFRTNFFSVAQTEHIEQEVQSVIKIADQMMGQTVQTTFPWFVPALAEKIRKIEAIPKDKEHATGLTAAVLDLLTYMQQCSLQIEESQKMAAAWTAQTAPTPQNKQSRLGRLWAFGTGMASGLRDIARKIQESDSVGPSDQNWDKK